MKNKYDVAKLFTLLLVVFAYSSKMFTDQAAIDNSGINETLSYITSLFIVLPVLCFCNLVEGNLFHYYIRNYIFCLNNRHLWYIIVCSHFLIARLLGVVLTNIRISILFFFYFIRRAIDSPLGLF